MQIAKTEVKIATPDGQMPGFLYKPAESGQKPAVILLMEAFGLTPYIQDVAGRIANEGFFCHERSSYNPSAAEDSWRELTQFFHRHLQKPI